MNNDALHQLERRLGELKTLYDGYFSGIEKREPVRLREQLVQEFRKLSQQTFNNTQIAFRVSNLRARMSAYESHWNRILKQIEEGTFKRDKLRAQKILAPENVTENATENAAESATRGATKPSSPAAPSSDALSDTAMRALYAKYAASRQRTGETPVSFDAMVSSLKKQLPVVQERYPGKTVEFRVLQKDGKTLLKAVPT